MRYSTERLEGKALEEAFKLLAERRTLGKTTVRMKDEHGVFRAVEAKRACAKMQIIARLITDELKEADVLLRGADAPLHLEGWDEMHSVDLRLQNGKNYVLCELKLSETPHQAIKDARKCSQRWLRKAAFGGRTRATWGFGRGGTVVANRVGFLGVAYNHRDGLRWKLELEDRDFGVVTRKQRRSYDSGPFKRSTNPTAQQKEQTYRKTSPIYRQINKRECRRRRQARM